MAPAGRGGDERRVRLVIADDHGLVREGLAALLAGHPRCVVVGQAATANEAVSRVQALNPDVLLLDIGLPRSSGVEVLGRLEGVSPRPRVVVVTMHTRLDLVAACFRAGGQGFVVKDSAASSLIAAIEAVMRGERAIDAPSHRKLFLGLDAYAARRSRPAIRPMLHSPGANSRCCGCLPPAKARRPSRPTSRSASRGKPSQQHLRQARPVQSGRARAIRRPPGYCGPGLGGVTAGGEGVPAR